MSMIRSCLKQKRLEKQVSEGREISLRTMEAETGITRQTLSALEKNAFEGTRNATTITLCKYFRCGVGDLLEYVEDEPEVVSDTAGSTLRQR